MIAGHNYSFYLIKHMYNIVLVKSGVRIKNVNKYVVVFIRHSTSLIGTVSKEKPKSFNNSQNTFVSKLTVN